MYPSSILFCIISVLNLKEFQAASYHRRYLCSFIWCSSGYNVVLAVALVLVLVYFDLLLNYFRYICIFIYNKYISTEWVNTHGDTNGLSYGEDNFTSADARMHSQLSLLERQWRNIIKYGAK